MIIVDRQQPRHGHRGQRSGHDKSQEHGFQHLGGQGQPKTGRVGPQHFSDADLLGSLFYQETGKAKKPQTGNKDGHDRKYLRELCDAKIFFELVLMLIVDKTPLQLAFDYDPHASAHKKAPADAGAKLNPWIRINHHTKP